MTDKSIKLLALAVVCGCSLIGVSLIPIEHREILLLLMFGVFLVTGLWFLVYWLLPDDGQK